jgi:uncharacterized heparinase superfamily protein
MDPAEIAARAARAPGHRLDDVAWRVAPAVWRARWEPPIADVVAGRGAAEPIGFLTASRAYDVRRFDSHGAAGIERAAERAREGHFAFFGYGDAQLERPLDVHRDPWSGRRWPDRHALRIDYRHSDIGDPKWIWELNRCQHLPLLVEAWLLSGDRHLADVAAADLTDWVLGQRVGRGIAWANGFEPALRVISFALCYDALRGSRILSSEQQDVVLLALWQHGRWIRRTPSTHSSANNHRIAELAGLIVLGLLVPELREAPSWEQEALAELEVEASRQILADGMGCEQSFAYHLFVLDLLLLVAAVLECRRRPLPDPLRAALERSADALALQLGDGEPPPSYGDSDDGRAVRLDGAELRDPRGLAAALAALLGHGGARRLAGRLDVAARWLFGAAGAERFAATSPAPPPGSGLLGDGGLIVLRTGGARVLFDVGPLGYGSLAAHGHADALQVTLSVAETDLVVDPGVGSYFGNAVWRDAFRGTAFHPTVCVDGADQSDAVGPFFWRRHALSRLVELDLERGIAVGEHDGYTRLADPVRHVRSVLAPPGAPLVVIVDRLEAEGRHEYAQTWPLHPELAARLTTEGVVEVNHDDSPRLVLVFAASVPAQAVLARGSERPPAGWWSPRLEARVPAWHCSWRADATGPVVLVAILWPVESEDWREQVPEIAVTSAEVNVDFDTSSGRRSLVVHFEPFMVTENPFVDSVGVER